ncbi:MAG: RNA-directed DNA polymerase [Hyphomicrobiaceae bacterium]|nr:RNA-directed DNA polymerase [Hyphomicrobiaceae bacterium]
MAGLFAWISNRLDPGRSVEDLARWLKIEVADLQSVEPNYTTFRIPKRSGGFRTIEAPDERLKEVQRLILRRVLGGLKAHPCALGFERGRSIVTHAQAHVGKALVIRLDLVDFFPNTQADRVLEYFRSIGWNRRAAQLLVKLTTNNRHLPQGAPTSPRLTNLVNYKMDARLLAMARKVGGTDATYTRYADDLTFSVAHEGEHTSRDIIRGASTIVRDTGYLLHRKKKTHILRSHQRQTVAGLVVNDKVDLPRETRRWLRAVEHRERLGREATLTPAQLSGWRSLRHMIDTQRDPPARVRRR